MLRWRPGKKELGCKWHQQGLVADALGQICVDVFVMPSIVDRRPLAVTVTLRSPDGHSTKHQLHARDEVATGSMLDQLSELVIRSGRDSRVAAAITADTERLMSENVDPIRAAIAKARVQREIQIVDDDIPF